MLEGFFKEDERDLWYMIGNAAWEAPSKNTRFLLQAIMEGGREIAVGR